jgi:hypothetical protein
LEYSQKHTADKEGDRHHPVFHGKRNENDIRLFFIINSFIQ